MDREAVIARYRRLRAICKDHNQAVLRHVPRSGIFDQARRLGLLEGKTIVVDSEDELMLIYDLAIHSPCLGRTRPIERYRKAARPAAGSDEALVLDAMCASRFTVWSIERRHEVAGLVVRDLMREEELWLMNLSLEASTDDAMTFASHLFAPAPFAMTTGMTLPVDETTILGALGDLPPLRLAAPDVLANDPLFATLVFRTALMDGGMEQIAFA